MKEYDLVVVGAGPAGCTAAGLVAAQGFNVVVLEKKDKPGYSPCAGYVSAMDYPVYLDKKVVEQQIESMSIHRPSGKTQSHPIRGFNVDRRGFDQALAGYAGEMGARMLFDSELSSVSGGDVILSDGRIIQGKVVLGADGVFSKTAACMGQRNDYVSSIQYHMSGCVVSTDVNEIFFDIDYAPGCYVWVFPSGEDKARVGLALRMHLAQSSPKDYLDSFIKQHQDFFPSARIDYISGGAIPVGGLHARLVYGNILLVGDAAGLADPITGGGISYGLLSARLAARVICEALEGNKVSSHLKRYDKLMNRVLGPRFMKASFKRKILDSIINNMDLESNLELIWPTYKRYWSE
ncbi:MAG: hypothetical protein B6U97_01290 [Candidatus Altiarchaeales archaeon ex4484_96]|nr:MAG: hypothetical protein B6U97_01290 [Candidatus Altiarchaeales archaeon ex4484_96]